MAAILCDGSGIQFSEVYHMFRAPKIFALTVGALLLAGSAAPLQARDNHDKCEQRIHKAEANLRREVERHGEHSRKAERRRQELENARRSCNAHDRDDHHEGDEHHENH